MNTPCPPSRHLARHVASKSSPLICIEGSLGALFDGETIYIRLIAPYVVCAERKPQPRNAKKAA